MNNKKDIHQLLKTFIAEERNIASNPFLSTRIMAAIDKKRNGQMIVISPVWRTALVAASILIAVFTGVATGSLYQSKNEVTDMVLMNDDSMENFSLYNQVGNE